MAGTLTELPQLREDLQLQRGSSTHSGSPTWLIIDKWSGKYFQISFEVFQLLSLWSDSKTAAELSARVEARFMRRPSPVEIAKAAEFLEQKQLLTVTSDWKKLASINAARPAWYKKAFHTYLFFKVPLFRPQGFLLATYPYVSLLMTKAFFISLLFLSVVGLYLTLRQWDQFIATFPFSFTFAGIVTSAISVVAIKSLHELGHAYTAVRYGCHVRTAGVAFMAFVPMLYTDVTDAWKLPLRKQRIHIDMAGIYVECAVAGLCLFLWAFLPDGPMRSAVFVLATVSIFMSFVVNLNPFMRFDGYFVLADLIGVPNLQPRGFNLLRYQIRRMLFASSEQPPEIFNLTLHVSIVVYAVITAVYRFFLYLGIAVLVYHFVIKLVGIMLLIGEVWYFILAPVWRETSEWWKMRGQLFANRHSKVVTALAAVALGSLFYPWSTSVSTPAILQSRNMSAIYSKHSGSLSELAINSGDHVSPQTLLFRIEDGSISSEKRIAAAEIELRRQKLRGVSSNADVLNNRLTILKELELYEQRALALEDRETQLELRSPIKGVVASVDSSLYQGTNVGNGQLLALIVSESGQRTQGYISAQDVARVAPGAPALFIPDDISMGTIEMTVSDISSVSIEVIDLPHLASTQGGDVAANIDANGSLKPVLPMYRITSIGNQLAQKVTKTQRGTLLVAGTKESIAERVFRQVASVIVRESGF